MKRITQRELRNQSGEIMRAVDRGERFMVARDGVPVGVPAPVERRRFADRATAIAAFASAPPIDEARLRRDLESLIDQTPRPRA